MNRDTELMERCRREMLEMYRRAAPAKEEAEPQASPEAPAEASSGEEPEGEENSGQASSSADIKESDIALCRFETRRYPAAVPCAAQVILRRGEEISMLIRIDESGKSVIAAAHVAQKSETWLVSVYSDGCCGIRDAAVELKAGQLLEIPVRLEEMPYSAEIFKGAAEK